MENANRRIDHYMTRSCFVFVGFLVLTCSAANAASPVVYSSVAYVQSHTVSDPTIYVEGYTTQFDGGGGTTYELVSCSGFTANGGSLIQDSGGTHCYQAAVFPTNAQQWGADATGASNSSSSIQAALNAEDAISGSNGNLLTFPAGIYQVAGIVLPSTNPTRISCVGKEIAKLKMPTSSNTFMFATHNWANPGSAVVGVKAEFDHCMFDFTNDTAGNPGIAIEATNRSSVHDNIIEDAPGPGGTGHASPALLLASNAKNESSGTNCPNVANGAYAIERNTFIGSVGPAIQGFDNGCSTLSDVSIVDNVFSGNATASGYYQVTSDNSSGWGYSLNKSFGSTGCGDLNLTQTGSTVINGNRFDATDNTSCSGSVESIVISMSGNKGITFTGNSIDEHADAPGPGVAWDLLEVIDNAGGNDARPTVTGNLFAAYISGYTVPVNAINYTGGNPSPNHQMHACSNAYDPNTTPPVDSSVLTCSEQQQSVTSNATQAAATTAYFPLSGFVTSSTLATTDVTYTWGLPGYFYVKNTKCGSVATAPGTGKHLTFTLWVNGAAPSGGPVCTFSGTSTNGNGSGNAVLVANTVAWQAVQDAGSVAAKPKVTITFASP